MFKIIYTNRFDKSLVKCAKRGLDIDLLKELIKDLSQTGTVPAKHEPHILSGKYAGTWECHIKSDWLLLWIKNENEITITMVNTGSHSDFF